MGLTVFSRVSKNTHTHTSFGGFSSVPLHFFTNFAFGPITRRRRSAIEARTRRSSKNNLFLKSSRSSPTQGGTCDKMDYDNAGNMQAHEMSNKMMSMVIKVGCRRKEHALASHCRTARTCRSPTTCPGGRARWVVLDTTEIHPDTSGEVLDKVCRLHSRPLGECTDAHADFGHLQDRRQTVPSMILTCSWRDNVCPTHGSSSRWQVCDATP